MFTPLLFILDSFDDPLFPYKTRRLGNLLHMEKPIGCDRPFF
jgi:hypothetical protein